MVLVNNYGLVDFEFHVRFFATSPFVSGHPTVSVNSRHENPALFIKYEESFSLHDVTTLSNNNEESLLQLRSSCYN